MIWTLIPAGAPPSAVDHSFDPASPRLVTHRLSVARTECCCECLTPCCAASVARASVPGNAIRHAPLREDAEISTGAGLIQARQLRLMSRAEEVAKEFQRIGAWTREGICVGSPVTNGYAKAFRRAVCNHWCCVHAAPCSTHLKRARRPPVMACTISNIARVAQKAQPR
jgi:hypothetical protein